MSEHELNQMHDWEDKCNEATMDKLTPEQRGWIIELHESSSSGYEFFEALNANTTEDESRYKPYFCPKCELPASGCQCNTAEDEPRQYYLPMNCPECGRQRLEFTPSLAKIKCEKCGIEDKDFPDWLQQEEGD